MPFTSKEFPDQLFQTFEELEEAKRRRGQVEQSLASREPEEKSKAPEIVATIVPASEDVIERRVLLLEDKVDELMGRLKPEKTTTNKEGLPVDTILRGVSKGVTHTLEVWEEGYLCSDGTVYPSLSAAALGVSGNRRSGWMFWTDVEGTPIGEITGRFRARAETS
jgi:hypothetical protein